MFENSCEPTGKTLACLAWESNRRRHVARSEASTTVEACPAAPVILKAERIKITRLPSGSFPVGHRPLNYILQHILNLPKVPIFTSASGFVDNFSHIRQTFLIDHEKCQKCLNITRFLTIPVMRDILKMDFHDRRVFNGRFSKSASRE